MTPGRSHPISHRPLGRVARMLLVAALLAWVPSVAFSRPAAACDCAGPQPLAEYARSGAIVLAGQVEGRDARGVRVAVVRWFAGDGAAPVVRIAGDFGNGASCGVGSEPPIGSAWLWVAHRPEEGEDLFISICAPTGRLDTPDGRALLAEAERTFGPGIGLPLVTGTGPGAGAGAIAAPLDPAPLIAAAGVTTIAVLVLGSLVFVAARRGRAPRP